MKIISLNVWGGRVYNPLKDFLEKYKDDVDIFCFQEMYHQAEKKNYNAKWADKRIENNLFEKLQELLSSYVGFFYPHFEDFWGLAIFVKKDIPLIKEGDFFVHYAASVEEMKRGQHRKTFNMLLPSMLGNW